MDTELKLLTSLTRKLPQIYGVGVVANKIKNFYNRKPRKIQTCEVLGFTMKLDPSECVDGGLLFYPQLYDHQEINFMSQNLKEGDYFLDVGSHIGFYSLIASSLVGKNGKVIAIEADPQTHLRLIEEIKINNITNIQTINKGVSDKIEILKFGLQKSGNKGGNSFIGERDEYINVSCCPLTDILEKEEWKKVKGMKLDIEGFEFRVLKQFLADTSSDNFPYFLIIEDNPEYKNRVDQNLVDLITSYGYKISLKTKLNLIAILD